MSSKARTLWFVLATAGVISAAGCSTGYKTQKYAKLSNTKDFEEDRSVVWKAALEVLSSYQLREQDESSGMLQTDWVYSTSTEKYAEHRVNGFPRKKYLRNRYRLAVKLERMIEAVRVTVDPEEEIEKLNSDGSTDGWESVSMPDSVRAAEIIRAIEMKILSRSS